MKGKLAAIVPAAGFSRRMGREKVLLPFRSSTVLETVLEKLRSAGIEETAVVLRPDLAPAAAIARRWKARVVINDHPEQEMLTSIRLGIHSLPAGLEAFFLWPADHPDVLLSTIQSLASSADFSCVVIPCHRGRRGHPIVVGADLRAAIEKIPEGEGLRYLWRTHPQVVREIAIGDPGVLVNLDTPEQYEKAMKSLDGGET